MGVETEKGNQGKPDEDSSKKAKKEWEAPKITVVELKTAQHGRQSTISDAAFNRRS